MKPKLTRSGFTLIEMVIVIAIMSIIIGAAIPITSKVLTYQSRKSTRGEIGGLADAVAEYFKDTLAMPSGVAALIVDPSVTGWSGPYLPGVVADSLTGKVGYQVDAWSRDYRFVINGDVLSLQSQGEDATWGTSQDIVLDLDVTPLRRSETLDRLDIANNAIQRYNTERSPSDPTLPANWSSARGMLISTKYLPNDARYQTDAWGVNLVEDPVGVTPVVRVKSVNVQAGGSAGASSGSGKKKPKSGKKSSKSGKKKKK